MLILHDGDNSKGKARPRRHGFKGGRRGRTNIVMREYQQRID
jgi:hypothetical protein